MLAPRREDHDPLDHQERAGAQQARVRARRDSRRRQHDAGSRDQRPSLRRRHQAGRQRRQLGLRAHARDRPRVPQADQRRQAAAAEADDQLPVGAGDLGHERLPQRASRQGEEHHRHAQLRHGSDPRRRQPELLGAAAHAGHVPVVPQRHRAEHDGVHRRHLARAGALPPRIAATRPRSRSNRRAAARTPSTSRSTSTTARAIT